MANTDQKQVIVKINKEKGIQVYHQRKPSNHEKSEQKERQTLYREPDVGLHPRTPGSCPGVKADAQKLSHPGIPCHFSLNPF